MKKLKLLVKTFIKTLKEYVEYLMKVGYKELFVNTVIIFCLFVLASFVFIPVNVVQDLIKDTLQLFAGFNETFDAVFYWVFKVISVVSSVLVFMVLFNKRFDSIKNKNNGESFKKVSKINKEDEFDLPKAKTK